ncbi:hypothetical protein EVAR_35488_1 [Eumeta japonica]|uniref:Uncharacterized protein n=1 Tax=Eumeta variegata TaxID=151549 RepID=A0A4C1X6P9_EUMVA|nr:hypothetical protein EVAR_35488_1 [Eumeta japonica]
MDSRATNALKAAVITARPLIGVSGAGGGNAPVDSSGGPLRTSRRGAAVSCKLTWTITSPASASTNHIADTSGANRRGRARRPRPTQAVLSACVLPNTRAVRRASRARPDRPAYFDYPQFVRSRLNITAPKLIARWYGRPALPDSEVPDAPRAYHAADGGAPTRTSWEQFSGGEPMLQGPSRRSERRQTGPGEREDTGSLTHAWLSRPPPSSATSTSPVPPPPHR